MKVFDYGFVELFNFVGLLWCVDKLFDVDDIDFV